MQLILKNGRVVDPANKIDEVRDIGIAEDVLVDPNDISKSSRTKILDVSGFIVCPGLIDMHVHLREPGFEYKEDIESGTHAAAVGGFTTILAMPNTQPPIDSVERVKDLNSRIEQRSLVHTLICPCISKDRLGKEITDITRLSKEPGVVAISDDGDCVQEYDIMMEAGGLAAKCGLPIVDHCEDCTVKSNDAVMREGTISSLMDVPGFNGESESNMVARDVELSKQTGAKLHIQHISYHKSIEILRNAQKADLPVTAEVSPHHLCLTHDIVPVVGTNSKMNPPLGSADDRQALLTALADDTISVIATDHAPHAPFEKAKSFMDAPFGILGLETALPVCLMELYEKGILSLSALISKFTTGPASVLNLSSGTLSLGSIADVTLFDIRKRYAIDITQSVSKSRNSPFHNKTVIGKILGTICSGKWVFKDNLNP